MTRKNARSLSFSAETENSTENAETAYNGCVVVGLRAKSLYFIDNEYKIDGVAFDDATLKVRKEK